MRQLKVVEIEPRRHSPEEALARIVPELIAAEQALAHVHRRFEEERRRLATKRGVAFIRPELVKQEFGGK